jgi:hypothetical protein
MQAAEVEAPKAEVKAEAPKAAQQQLQQQLMLQEPISSSKKILHEKI